MSDGYFYWVVQTVQGRPILHGPYRSQEAAENRLNRCSGGQVDILRTFERNPQKALDEYKAKV